MEKTKEAKIKLNKEIDRLIVIANKMKSGNLKDREVKRMIEKFNKIAKKILPAAKLFRLYEREKRDAN